jgi:type IV pilus assembly protein PilW
MKRPAIFPRGHTLVEVTIALALGLVVTVGAVSLYRSQRAAFGGAGDALQMREAGLAALTVIGQQLQMTGFVPADAPLPQLRPTLFGCSSARPTGADDNLTCETPASRSDGIAIRYVGDNISTWPSSTGQSTDCLGQAVNAGEAAPGAGRVLIVNRFYTKQSGSTSEFELYATAMASPVRRSRWWRASNAYGSSIGLRGRKARWTRLRSQQPSGRTSLR